MKSRNALVAAVVIVVIAVCLVAVFATQDDVRDGDEGQDGTDDSYREYFPGPITDEMRDRAPADDVRAELEDAIDTFVLAVADGDPTVIADAVDGYTEDYEWYHIQYWVLYYYYCLDVGTYEDEYLDWTSLMNEADAEWKNAVIDAMDGESATYVREAVDAVWGEGTTDSYLGSGVVTPEETELLQRESELNSMYYGTDDPYERDEIFLGLIDVRNRLAEIHGYDTYADYAYSETFLRDYTPNDLVAVKEAVKTYIAPLLFEAMYAYYAEDFEYSYEGVDELYADISPFIHSISDGFGDLYDCMLGYGLIDFSDVETKSPVGYTLCTVSGGTKVMYIFNDPILDHRDAITLVHEFGHAAAYGLHRTWSDAIDINETQSQGLEALFALSPLNPIEASGDVAVSFLFPMLSSIIDGCIYDEFQQRAYVSGAETPEDLDSIFREVEDEFGVYHAGHWTGITHTFSEPFYYIGYCTSAFSALGIFVDGLSDYDAAVQEYLGVNAYHDGGFRAMVEDLGLLDIFDPDDVRYVAETIVTYLLAEDPVASALPVAVAA